MLDIARDIDFYGEQEIPIISRAKDYSDITNKEGEFSIDFEVPASAKNMAHFDNYGFLGVNSSFNPHKGISAAWTVNDSTVFWGRLELLNVVYKNGEPYSFSLVFYGRQRSLANVFGSDTLADVDWSKFDHELTYQNVLNTWFGVPISGNFAAGDIMYPIIDSRVNYWFGAANINAPGNISNQNNPILLTDLRPAIKFTTFLKHIFEHYGLVLEGQSVVNPQSGDFLIRAYLLINRFSGLGEGLDTVDENLTGYSKALSSELTAVNQEAIIKIPEQDADSLGQWDGEYFTAQITGVHNVRFYFLINIEGQEFAPGKYSVAIIKNGAEVVSEWIVTQNVQALLDISVPDYSMNLNAGDEIHFRLKRLHNGVFIGMNAKVVSGWFRIQGPINLIGQTVSLNDQMTDEKIVDILNGVLKSYNWVLVPDEMNVKKWRILTNDEYLAEGVVRDWSRSLRIENLVFEKPKVYKNIKLRYKDSEAAVKVAFKDLTGREFGSVHIQPDVEFAEDEMSIESPFGLVPPSLFRVLNESGEDTGEVADVTIHKSINIEGKPVKEPYLIFYFNGVGFASISYYLQSGISGVDVVANEMHIYPRIAASRTDGATLCYGLESDLMGGVATNTAYRLYWESVLKLQYSKTSRVLKDVLMTVPAAELMGLKLNDELYLERQYWRVVEVERLTNKMDTVRATLMSSRSLEVLKNDVRIGLDGELTFEEAPTKLDITAAGGAKRKSNNKIYGTFLRAQIQPNILRYDNIMTTINNTVINEINEISGRFRSYKE